MSTDEDVLLAYSSDEDSEDDSCSEDEYRAREVERRLSFQRRITEEEWDRFCYYAKRIRSLQLSWYLEVNDTTLSSLCSNRPLHTIFPNINSLQVRFNHWTLVDFIPYIPHFLNHTLVDFKVSIEIPIDINELRSLLTPVSNSCPSLCSVEILASCGTTGDSAVFERFITRFHQLEALSCQLVVVSPGLLLHLGQLPSLRKWSIIEPQGSLLHKKIPGVFDGLFSAMTGLSIQQSTWLESLRFLKRLSSPLQDIHLTEELKVLRTPPISLDIPDRLFAQIGSHQQLTRLQLVCNTPCHGSPQSTARVFSQLFSLHRLKLLSIVTPLVNHLSNDFIQHAAEAWPNLQSLTIMICAKKSDEDNPHITLEGLLPLLTGCPKIETLQISVQCQPVDLNLIDGIKGNRNLRSVRLSNSPLLYKDAMLVLRCLSIMSPMANDVTGDGKADLHNPSAWEGSYRKSAWEYFNSVSRDFFRV